MKRLSQISFNIFLTSLFPILSWLILGIIFHENVANIFSVTYPLQFVFTVLLITLGTGANVVATKLKNKNIVYSNMLLSMIIGGLATILIFCFLNQYMSFMNFDFGSYRILAVYAVIWMYFNFLISMLSENLYFEERNKEANILNIIFNFVNFISIIGFSLLFKNPELSVYLTLIFATIIILVSFFRYFRFSKIEFKMKEILKNSSFNIIRNISFFLIYFIGYSNSFSYGMEYIVVINLACLTTDTQWDMTTAIDIINNIDISKNQLDYKKTIADSMKFTCFLILSIILMNVIIYPYYKPNVLILAIFCGLEIINFLVYPFISARSNYLQIISPKKGIYHLSFSYFVRIICSFIPSVFCTYIGQMFSMVYYSIALYLICRKEKAFKKTK